MWLAKGGTMDRNGKLVQVQKKWKLAHGIQVVKKKAQTLRPDDMVS